MRSILALAVTLLIGRAAANSYKWTISIVANGGYEYYVGSASLDAFDADTCYYLSAGGTAGSWVSEIKLFGGKPTISASAAYSEGYPTNALGNKIAVCLDSAGNIESVGPVTAQESFMVEARVDDQWDIDWADMTDGRWAADYEDGYYCWNYGDGERLEYFSNSYDDDGDCYALCEQDPDCTGGFFYHPSSSCYHFGTDGAEDEYCDWAWCGWDCTAFDFSVVPILGIAMNNEAMVPRNGFRAGDNPYNEGSQNEGNMLGFLSGYATGYGDTFFNRCYHIVGEHLNDAGQDITNQLEWEIDGFSGLGMDFELCFDWFGAVESVESNVPWPTESSSSSSAAILGIIIGAAVGVCAFSVCVAVFMCYVGKVACFATRAAAVVAAPANTYEMPRAQPMQPLEPMNQGTQQQVIMVQKQQVLQPQAW